MKINKWNKYYRLLVVIVGWFGLVGSWYFKIVSTPQGESVGLEILDSLSHYTIQSNVIVVSWFTYTLFKALRKGNNSTANTKYKTGIMIIISLTFIIYATLLQGLWEPQSMNAVLAYITHYITPIAIIVDWIYCEFTSTSSVKLSIKDILKWLIYPLCYAVYAVIYGYFSGRYMYPFLNAPVIGYPVVFLSVAGLAVILGLIGLIVVGFNNIIHKRKTIDI